MKDRGRDASPGGDLRDRAEKRVADQNPQDLGTINHATREEIERMLHELHVHQVELQMQNEALRAAQAEIEASRSRYADLYDFAPVGYLSLDRRGFIVDANLMAASMFGLERALLKGTPFLQFVAREDRTAFHNHLHRAFEDPAKQESELRLVSKGGQAFYASLESLVTSSDENGPVCRSVIVDVTARKLAEEERIRLAAAVEHTAEGIVIADPHWKIIYVNDATCRMTGFERAELIGRNVSMLLDKTQKAVWRPAVQPKLALGLSWSGRVTHRRKDGTTYLADLTISPVTDASSRVINYVGVARDITEQVAAEKQARQGQKMEAIGTLAGGIAHDFNNVLAAIIGFAELALDDAPKASLLKRNMEYVIKAATRGRDLVRQILTFSRKGDLERKPIHLAPVINDAVKLLRASLPTTLAIEFHAGAASDEVFADAVEINQLLINLGTNAAYAMREKGGRLTIALTESTVPPGNSPPHPDLAPGNYIVLSIEDTGGGMDEKTMSRIFEPFFTTKERGQGTGLGLSVVHGTVRNLGGAITVASDLAKGTTFRIFLPKTRTTEATLPETTRAVSGGHERILFVDDEHLLAESVRGMLGRLGYEVVATTDPSEALSVFSEAPERFDLVITDYTMPHMTGIDLARKLVKIRQGVPIMLCTGYNEQLSQEEIQALGIRELCIKPLSRQEMAETIRRVLDKGKG